MIPSLVTLEGDPISGYGEIAELLGMDQGDVETLLTSDRLNPRQASYLNAKYPEYIGAWPIIVAKIITGGIGIGKAIAKKVKEKRASKAANAAADVEFQKKVAVIIEKAKAKKEAQEKAQKEQLPGQGVMTSALSKNIVPILIPAALIAALFLFKR